MGPIVIFTDFGLEGPWVGQVRLALHQVNADMPVFDLMHDAPRCNPKAAAYLLAGLSQWYPVDTVFLAVVDPGVGGDRKLAILEADGRWFVGPDNGLFEVIARRATHYQYWQPEHLPAPDALSPTFHGRDLFAPVAAKLANNLALEILRQDGAQAPKPDWPLSLDEAIYVDHFGNVCTGLFASDFPEDASLRFGDMQFPRARTYGDVAAGDAFCYVNSCGMLEIAVNQGRADQLPGMKIGAKIAI